MRRLADFLAREDGPPGRDLGLLSVLFAAAFFAFLGRAPLLEPDEGRYAEIPREMLESGDFITPRLNHVKYFEKPPLFYWLNCLSFAVLGRNELAARLPTALAGLSGVLLAYHIGRKAFGRRAGVLSALILGTSAGYLALGRINIIDMTLTFFLSASLGSFLLASREGEPRKGLYYHLFYLSAALAVLTKGLIGIVFPAGIVILYILFSRRWRLLREMRLPTGIPLFLLAAAPWFILVSLRNPEFPEFFFINEHLNRYLTKGHERYEGVWFPAAVFLGCFLPWTILLPPAAVRLREGRKGDGAGPRLFLLLWGGFILVFFTFSSSQLIPYVLPVLPAAALLLGETFSKILGGEFEPRGPFRFLSRGNAARSLALLLLIWCPILLAGTSFITGWWMQKRSSRELALLVRDRAGADDRIASFWLEQGLPFYTKRRVIIVGHQKPYRGELEFGSRQEDCSAWFLSRAQFWELWDSGQTLFALIDVSDLEEVRACVKTPVRILGRESEKVLFTNR